MMLYPGRWCFRLFLLVSLTALPPASHAGPTTKKNHGPVAAKAKTVTKAAAGRPGKQAGGRPGTGAKASHSAQGKKARIPRTLRTVPVSPVVRENAVDRVQRNLAGSTGASFLYPEALQGFFAALSAEQAERATGGPASRTVRVLQFGDSHTAADIFTGEMRAQLQQQFGDGGLGFQFAGHPFAGYHLAGSSRTQSGGWVTEGNRFTALGNGDLGLGGLSIETASAGQSITLETHCDSLQLHYLRQPGGGRLQFRDNGNPVAVVPTANDVSEAADATGVTSRAGTFAYACGAGQHDFEFTTLDAAPVKLFGIVTEQPGATYECLGINGAVAPLMLRWDQPLFTDYLRQREPDLIVLAYGTNEAGISAEHLEDYPAKLAKILAILHRTAPQASVLLLGPADRAVASGRGRHMAWHPMLGTSRIIAMQQAACQAHGCAFWDTRRRMGGFGSMQQWVAAGWAQPDRTHLTGTGYRALADALYADLIRAYNLYQQHSSSSGQDVRQTP